MKAFNGSASCFVCWMIPFCLYQTSKASFTFGLCFSLLIMEVTHHPQLLTQVLSPGMFQESVRWLVLLHVLDKFILFESIKQTLIPYFSSFPASNIWSVFHYVRWITLSRMFQKVFSGQIMTNSAHSLLAVSPCCCALCSLALPLCSPLSLASLLHIRQWRERIEVVEEKNCENVRSGARTIGLPTRPMFDRRTGAIARHR
jgi:hypothetical protein